VLHCYRRGRKRRREREVTGVALAFVAGQVGIHHSPRRSTINTVFSSTVREATSDCKRVASMKLEDDAPLHVASNVIRKLFLLGVSGEHFDNLLKTLTKLAVSVKDSWEEEAVQFVGILRIPLLLFVLAFGDGVSSSRGSKMTFGMWT